MPTPATALERRLRGIKQVAGRMVEKARPRKPRAFARIPAQQTDLRS